MATPPRLAVAIALAGLSAGALLVDRSLQFYVGRDSSVFLYVARSIQQGGVPYRDVWDHKPPLIYYLDAIGLTLADRGIPGIEVLEFTILFAAASFGFVALRRVMGVLPALLGSIAWLTTLPLILDGGNFPEEYALPLQFGALGLYLSERSAFPSRWRWVLIGVTAGLAVLLKPTVLGIWAAVYLAEAAHAWRARSWRRIATPIVFGALGGLAVTLPVGAYFVASGAGDDLVDQVIRFNTFYSQSTLSERLAALAEGVLITSFSGLFPIALAGWIAALLQLVRGSAPAPVRAFFLVAILALPLDLALASATGRPYRVYFLACLPAMGSLAAIAAAAARPALERAALRLSLPRERVIALSLIALAVFFASASPVLIAHRREGGPNAQQVTRPLATAYVLERTATADPVLFWGGEAGLNYTTGRRSPTRYAYQYALYMRGYQSPERIDEVMLALQREPPALIVDASPATIDVPPLDAAERDRWTLQEPEYAVLPEMDRIFRWVEEHYVRVAEVGSLHWPIYARRDRTSLTDEPLRVPHVRVHARLHHGK